ncbi:MAG: hypothetical protein K9N46_13205 [Candidatus Marinimicrobia bacterium]|nr:hypothetical protein [Candidatus Neomarinimicrobiota bacterium]MCF7829740.1 hypothetical protein [Candidatus Neomarinimicrobiota bacterium]MCF7881690.1 hypothetical protein [Candidatus Neomarinimicrobiota bacterium]
MKQVHKIVLCVVFFFTWGNLLPAQELETAWQEYISAETRYQDLMEQRRIYEGRQQSLLERQQRLRDNHRWYNGWIINMQQAGVSEDLVVVADSLREISRRLQSQNAQRDSLFEELKATYQDVLRNPQQQDMPSGQFRELTNVIIKSLITKNPTTGALPDYTDIVNNLYQDSETRQTVLQDLQRVLEKKIVLLDSLMTSRRNDLSLLRSMEEFQENIQLQSQTDADVSRAGEVGGNTRAGESGPSQGYFNDYNSGIETSADRIEKIDEEGQDFQQVPAKVDVSPGSKTAVKEDIDRLERSRNEYQRLLESIRKELKD